MFAGYMFPLVIYLNTKYIIHIHTEKYMHMCMHTHTEFYIFPLVKYFCHIHFTMEHLLSIHQVPHTVFSAVDNKTAI